MALQPGTGWPRLGRLTARRVRRWLCSALTPRDPRNLTFFLVALPLVLAAAAVAPAMAPALLPGSAAQAGRLIALLQGVLLGAVAPLVLGWGLWLARRMQQLLRKSEQAGEEKGRLLSIRNHQLQVLLQASRTMASVLEMDEVLKTIVDQVVSHTRFKQASLVLGPHEFGEFRVVASRGLSTEHLRFSAEVLQGPLRAYSPVEWSRLAMAPVVIDDAAVDPRTRPIRQHFLDLGFGSLMSAPMIVKDRYIGALTVYVDRTAAFTPDEVSLVAALASQGALAVENARLYTLTETHRRRQQRAMVFLEEVSSALAHTRVGVQALIRQVAQATARLFEPSSVFITIEGDTGGPGRIRRSLMVHESCGLDAEETEALRRELLEEDAWARGVEPPWQAAIGLPITLDGERLGHFEIYVTGEGRRIDQEEVSIAQAFVHLTASALGNAHLVSDLRRAVGEVERAWMGTLEALTSALETRDNETQGHSRRVVEYTLALAQRMDVPEDQLLPIIRGALLHDIGKIGIPDSILRKPGPLSADEWKVMRTHTAMGYHMLRNVEFLQEALPVIMHHHERFDGTGYPMGLVGTDTPLGARIFSVADAYDALTSDRPYRKATTHAKALEEIARNLGTQFDPAVVEALLNLPTEELERIRNREQEVRDCEERAPFSLTG